MIGKVFGVFLSFADRSYSVVFEGAYGVDEVKRDCKSHLLAFILQAKPNMFGIPPTTDIRFGRLFAYISGFEINDVHVFYHDLEPVTIIGTKFSSVEELRLYRIKVAQQGLLIGLKAESPNAAVGNGVPSFSLDPPEADDFSRRAWAFAALSLGHPPAEIAELIFDSESSGPTNEIRH
jgi:hypothetical protein